MEPWRRLATTAEAGQRLDRFLQSSLEGVTRSQVKKWIEDGRVTVDGAPAKAGHPLKAGEAVEVAVPPPPAIAPEPELIPVEVVYEDDSLVVVFKPAGMVVHPGAGRATGTLVSALLGRGTALSPVGAPLRPGIVHRLDKGTSGLLVVAKTAAAHLELARALAAREVDRRYVALLWGTPDPGRGRISAGLARSRADRRRMRVVSAGGREAATRYVVRWSGGTVSAVALALESGRTHQIRAHFKFLGHPVFGDPEYGGRSRRLGTIPAGDRARAEAALRILERQALHAATLGFRHPATGKRLDFESAPPRDMMEAAAVLGAPGRALSIGVKEDV